MEHYLNLNKPFYSVLITFMKGVTDANTIIGAGCLIYKDVRANSIIVNRQEHLIKSI